MNKVKIVENTRNFNYLDMGEYLLRKSTALDAANGGFMPLRVSVARSGRHSYLRICQSCRNAAGEPRTEVFLSFGRSDDILADEPGFIDELRTFVDKINVRKKKLMLAAASRQLDNFLQELEKAELQGFDGEKYSRMVNVGSALLRRVWKTLGLDRVFSLLQRKRKIEYSYDKAAYLLCEQRILNPLSKFNTFINRSESAYNFSDIDTLDNLYKVLDLLFEDKQYIVRYLTKKLSKLTDRNLSVAYYDVTTFSFESQKDNALLNFGMSKDHKNNEVQVTMGLSADANGLPLNYELFSGNTSEFKTILPVISRLKQTQPDEKLIIVADRGLNSNENLVSLLELGCDFVIAQKLRGCKKNMRELILNNCNWQYFDKDSNGNIIAKYKSIESDLEIYETIIDEKTGKTKKTNKIIEHLKTYWIVSWTSLREKKDKKDQERAIKKAKQAIKNNPSGQASRGFAKYIKAPAAQGKAVLNQDRIDEDARWHGFHAVCTNIKTDNFKYILGLYHNLWKIEECFRTSKSQLEMRPCFVWTEKHIQGHFLSCYISLLIEKYIHFVCRQNNITGATTDKICKALRKAIVAQTQSAANRPVFLRMYQDGLFDKIGEAFGLVPLGYREIGGSLCKKLRLHSIPVCTGQ